MTKKLVIVESLSQYRMRYVFEVEENIHHALDEYVMKENDFSLKEFSQLHLEPTVIVSHREITKEEYLRIFDEDNEHLQSWEDKHKLSFINKIDYSK
jgi:hypothetical protein